MLKHGMHVHMAAPMCSDPPTCTTLTTVLERWLITHTWGGQESKWVASCEQGAVA